MSLFNKPDIGRELDSQNSIFFEIFDDDPISHLIIDKNGKILKCNNAFEKLIKSNKRKIEGKMNALELISTKDIDRIKFLFNERNEGNPNIPNIQNISIVTAENQFKFVRTYVKYYGKYQRRLISLVEIPEKYFYDETIKRSEKRFNDLAELLPEIIFELDLEGNIRYTNSIGLETFGYSKIDLVKGVNFLDVLHPNDHTKAQNNIAKKIIGEEFPLTRYLAIKKDGSTFPVLLHSNIIYHDGKPVGVRGVVIDETDRVEYENTLNIEKAQSKFYLDLLSHDIGNIHQGLKGFLNLALVVSNEITAKYLQGAILSLDKSERLIRNVKIINSLEKRIEPNKKDEISTIIERILYKFDSIKFSKLYKINIRKNKNNNIVHSPVLIEQLIENILHNAIKHNDKEEALIFIEVENNTPHFINVKITDNGPGFPESILAYLTSSIENRLLTDMRRIGFGLPVSISIAKELKISIICENKAEKTGAIFQMQIPLENNAIDIEMKNIK